jgi:tRNA pseudouridine32 synthase/23S rRNA pseudouridine746 synthase
VEQKINEHDKKAVIMTEIVAPFTLEITVSDENISAIDCLSSQCQLSKRILKDCMTKGAVWLHRHGASSHQIKPIRRANNTLSNDDQLFLYYNPQVLNEIPPKPTLLHDHDQYSIWCKPYGMLSHGSKWGDHCAITRWVEQHHQPQRPSYLVHRLDRATSGIMLIAHNKKIAANLCAQFESRQTDKRYHAVVTGELLGKHILTAALDDKSAHSEITALSYDKDNNSSLVDVIIKTGRKHQIRRHLSQLGYPIIGDRLYNPAYHPTVITNARKEGSTSDENRLCDLQLRAYHLAFNCPVLLENQLVTLDKEVYISTAKKLYKR